MKYDSKEIIYFCDIFYHNCTCLMAQKQTDSVIAVDAVPNVYIITYSNADTYIFNRQSFAEPTIIAFHKSTKTKVEDSDFVASEGHPANVIAPKTLNAT